MGNRNGVVKAQKSESLAHCHRVAGVSGHGFLDFNGNGGKWEMMELETLAEAALQMALHTSNMSKMLDLILHVTDSLETLLNRKMIWYNLILNNCTGFDWHLYVFRIQSRTE